MATDQTSDKPCLVTGRSLNQLFALLRTCRPRAGTNTSVSETTDGTVISASTDAPAGAAGCECTRDELYAIWRMTPDEVVFILTQFPTPLPEGYRRKSACLRFASVSGGMVTGDFDGDTLPADVKDTLQAISASDPALSADVVSFIESNGSDGCYAVEFFGYCRAHHPARGGPAGRDWHSSSVDFRIYRILCSH